MKSNQTLFINHNIKKTCEHKCLGKIIRAYRLLRIKYIKGTMKAFTAYVIIGNYNYYLNYLCSNYFFLYENSSLCIEIWLIRYQKKICIFFIHLYKFSSKKKKHKLRTGKCHTVFHETVPPNLILLE